MTDCTHDNWRVRGKETIGWATCTDCQAQIPIDTAFNRLHDRMLEALERVNKMAEYVNTIPKAAPKIKGQQKKHRPRNLPPRGTQRKVKG